jgi:hypothetical protein
VDQVQPLLCAVTSLIILDSYTTSSERSWLSQPGLAVRPNFVSIKPDSSEPVNESSDFCSAIKLSVHPLLLTAPRWLSSTLLLCIVRVLLSNAYDWNDPRPLSAEEQMNRFHLREAQIDQSTTNLKFLAEVFLGVSSF